MAANRNILEKACIYYQAGIFNGRLKKAERRRAMIHLELVAEIGSGPMEIVRLYLRGLLSFVELENILDRDKASLAHTFMADSEAGKIGELLLSGLRGYMV